MSTEIDYQRKAYISKDKYGENLYIVLHEIGASNCFDASGRRARDWRVLTEGNLYQVCRVIAEYAGHAAGGMLTLNRMGGWKSDFTNVLQFIRAYDKVIKAAFPLEQAAGEDKRVIDAYHQKKLEESKVA